MNYLTEWLVMTGLVAGLTAGNHLFSLFDHILNNATLINTGI